MWEEYSGDCEGGFTKKDEIFFGNGRHWVALWDLCFGIETVGVLTTGQGELC